MGFITPLIPIGVYDMATEKRLPAYCSFCTPTSDSIVVTAIKKAEKSDHIIVGYYEAEGKETTSEIEFMRKPEKTLLTCLSIRLKKKLGKMESSALSK